MCAIAMRMGRVAMPLRKKVFFSGAKDLGKNLVSFFVPEFTSHVCGKKRPRKAVRDVLKKSTKKLMVATQEWRFEACGNEAGGDEAGGAVAIGRAERFRGRTPDHGPGKLYQPI